MALKILVPVPQAAPSTPLSKYDLEERLSALAKAIRLRDGSALRCLAHIAVWHPNARTAAARQILVSAGSDSIDASVQMYVALKYQEMLALSQDLVGFTRVAAEALFAITGSKNWYHDKHFSTAIALWIHTAENDGFEMPSTLAGVKDIKLFTKRLLAIDNPLARYCVLVEHYVSSDMTVQEYAKFLRPVTSGEASSALSVLIGHSELATSEDYLNCAFALATLSVPSKKAFPLLTASEASDLSIAAITAAREKPEPTPLHCLDGVMTTRAIDRRFSPSYPQFLGCCYAWHELGALTKDTHIKAAWCTPDALAERFNIKLPIGV